MKKFPRVATKDDRDDHSMTNVAFFFLLSARFGNLGGVVITTAAAVRMQMGSVTPTVINKAGFVGVLSPAATRRDEGGILSASIAPGGRQTIKRSLCEARPAMLCRRRQM